MFVDKTNKIFEYIKERPDFSVLVAKTDEIEALMIQILSRDNVEFIALRNIVVKEEHRRKGIFKSIINALEQTNRNVLIDDLINDNLYKFFANRNYDHYSYVKNNDVIHCMKRLI